MPCASMASTVASAAVIETAGPAVFLLVFLTGSLHAYRSGNEFMMIIAFRSSSDGVLPNVFCRIALILPVR